MQEADQVDPSGDMESLGVLHPKAPCTYFVCMCMYVYIYICTYINICILLCLCLCICMQIDRIYTLAVKYPYRDYFKPEVSTL